MEKENELKTIHDNWLFHPMTKAAFGIIEGHKQRFVRFMSDKATDQLVLDPQFRLCAASIQTCDKLKLMLSDKSNFNLTPNELNNL